MALLLYATVFQAGDTVLKHGKGFPHVQDFSWIVEKS